MYIYIYMYLFISDLQRHAPSYAALVPIHEWLAMTSWHVFPRRGKSTRDVVITQIPIARLGPNKTARRPDDMFWPLLVWKSLSLSLSLSPYIYIYIHTHTCIIVCAYVYTYIYIYICMCIERERKRIEQMYIYIYIVSDRRKVRPTCSRAAAGRCGTERPGIFRRRWRRVRS